ncbi:MAG: helix-turn-helix domain-containing protein, partial [Thermomicrobia bacterium]|nr:helix-turn-helix domain-containing protein [Thermomicrobia bacterium]
IPRALLDAAAPAGIYAVAVYVTMAAYALGSGRAFPAQSRMAEELHCAESTVKRALAALRRDGHLPAGDEGVGRARCYAMPAVADGIALPVAALRALRDAEGALGAALAVALAAECATQSAIAAALGPGASVDTIGPCLRRLVDADLVAMTTAGRGGVRRYRLPDGRA